jgi:hypothetical protein
MNAKNTEKASRSQKYRTSILFPKFTEKEKYFVKDNF